ncbi:MAG: aquaporin [Bdellovibrionaceae bacterium]|nr:aquaporin [Pseudobdellovibrionaceae bacterium]
MRLSHKAAAEFIGTFALVFAGCGSVMLLERLPGSISPMAIPLVFGAVIACMIYAVGHVSGAHFNPAVTLAFSVARHFPMNEVPAYWAAQFGGALFASFLLSALLPAGVTFGATVPALPLLPALGVEMVLSFLLMFVIIAVATDTRAEGTMAGAAIGGIVSVAAYVGGPLTGASMNPARSLAPALFEHQLGPLWIYFIGPALGTLVAALAYEWIRGTTEKKKASGCC